MTLVEHRPVPLLPARLLAPGDPAYRTDQAATGCLWATIDELTREFGAEHAEARIIGVAIGAFRDLRGSVPVDALPELISRSVRVRLAGAEPGDRSPADPAATPDRATPRGEAALRPG